MLVLPAYALGGVDAAKGFLALLGGATVGMAALLAYRVSGHARASLLARTSWRAFGSRASDAYGGTSAAGKIRPIGRVDRGRAGIR